jgi:hypothetical protein
MIIHHIVMQDERHITRVQHDAPLDFYVGFPGHFDASYPVDFDVGKPRTTRAGKGLEWWSDSFDVGAPCDCDWCRDRVTLANYLRKPSAIVPRSQLMLLSDKDWKAFHSL